MHERNRVPACVTPERLMRYLEQRNTRLAPQFKSIARYYKAHGERHAVRWDYAFYQMLIETNFLTYRTGSGRWGDVRPSQNNFAGIGATGGGVPGDRYPDVSTGVLAQIQHLVAYSGEIVERPVAARTRLVQQKVVELSRALGRPVTFRDLAGRWAADRRYGTSIESLASRYRAQFCDNQPEQQIAAKGRGSSSRRAAAAPPNEEPFAASSRAIPARSTNMRTAAIAHGAYGQAQASAFGGPLPLVRPPAPAMRPRACRVWTASYGGNRNVLIQSVVGEELHLTALQVLEGQEDELAASFIQTHAVGGQRIGAAFPNREAALMHAFDLCPEAAREQR